MYDHMMLTAINPQAASNFLDEDHMKVMRSVGKACHPATAKTKWANRYIVKKAITWMRMQNKKTSAPKQMRFDVVMSFEDM